MFLLHQKDPVRSSLCLCHRELGNVDLPSDCAHSAVYHGAWMAVTLPIQLRPTPRHAPRVHSDGPELSPDDLCWLDAPDLDEVCVRMVLHRSCMCLLHCTLSLHASQSCLRRETHNPEEVLPLPTETAHVEVHQEDVGPDSDLHQAE